MFRYGWSLGTAQDFEGPFSSNNFFPDFLLFFFREERNKQEKQETFPEFGNFTEGKIFGRLRIPIIGEKKWKMWKYQKVRETKNLEILTKNPSIRTAYRRI